VIIRFGSEADAAQVWPLVQAFATSFVPEREPFESAWGDLVYDWQSLVAVAEDEGRVLGYLAAHVRSTLYANGALAWIEELMVAQDARRGGVGGELVRFAEEWASSWHGAAYIAVSTRRAAEFYTALGYEESAVFFRKMLG